MKRFKIYFIPILIGICCLLISCDKSDNEDWTEIVRIQVANELGEYIPWGAPEDKPSREGLKIRENNETDWFIIPIDGINGFVYQEGFSYTLSVEKTHLGNPPSDGMSVRYELIEILSKE